MSRRSDRSKMPKRASLRLADPYLAREQERYESPLPSREWILSVLEEEGVAAFSKAFDELIAVLQAKSDAFGA